jgi:MoaA/NifB/PqqE/SkfB family radical SAM enzyme
MDGIPLIGVSKLLLGAASESDGLRYDDVVENGPDQIKHAHGDVKSNKPIVVWNMTNRCNLKCLHCYAEAKTHTAEGELTTEEARKFIEDVAEFNAPVLLFSGGEPFLRDDLFDLAEYASSLGLRPVISTNGTLITEEKARRAKEVGIMYVGVSLDGLKEVNDHFRGVDGAFDRAIEGMNASLRRAASADAVSITWITPAGARTSSSTT